jgi:PAS domain S-box-containing protein
MKDLCMNLGAANESSLKQVLNGLQDSQPLADFLEAAFDAVVAFDSQERISYWNPAAGQMFGWTAQEARGKTSAELFWPRDTAEEEENHRQRQLSLQQGVMLWGEHMMSRKVGSSLWVQYMARGVFDADGKFTGYLALYRDISIQARLHEKEEQLQQSNQKLNDILESIQDDFYVLDHNWNFVYASKSFTSKIGKEPEDFVGNNIWEMFPKHLGTAFEKNLRAAMEKQEIQSFEIAGKYTNAWYRMKAFPSAEGITVLGTDITERKRVEDQLRELSQRLTYHVDNSPLAVIEWGPDMRLIRWSAAAERMFGWKAKEVLGKQIEDFRWVYDEDTDQVKGVSTELRTGRDPQRFSANRNYRKDGSVIYCEWYNSSLLDEAGNLRSILSLVSDVTDRRHAEQELAQSEERYRHLVKYAPTGIYEIDIKTMQFIDVNESMCQILGYTREELLSMSPSELLHEEGRNRFRERMLKALAGEKVSPQTEYIVKAKDGREIWGLLTTTLNYANGQPRSVSVVAHDITERKRQEELSYALNSVNDAIHSTPDLNEVMQRAMKQAANALRCDTAAVSLREGNAWLVRYVHGLSPDTIGLQMNDDEERHAVLAVQTKQPVAVNDAFHDPRFNREHFRKWGVRSVLVVPLILRGEARGVIFFNYQRSETTFTDYQIDFVVKLSASLSLALESARLLEDLRTELAERKRAEEALLESEKQLRLLNETLEQKVQEKTAEVRRLASDLTKAEQRERRRISRILHDDLQQRVYAIQMQLPFLRDELRGNETAQREVSDVDRQLSEIVQVSRQLSIDLNPPILHDEGLAHAVNWLAAQMRRQYGLTIEVQAGGPFAIPDEELHGLLFNCIRELLFNVVKHARASRAVVGLEWSNTGLRIEVRDDGKGFPVYPPEQQRSEETSEEEDLQPGLGLVTIRRQLSLFGGCMEIESNPGAGTQITLIVPIGKAE